jgi:15-cis-phytoene synthase
MLVRILGVTEKADPYARSLGRAFQYINMIRDIAEDNAFGRRYLPLSEMKRYGLASLDKRHVMENESAFRLFIHAQLAHFDRWLRQAQSGYTYLPKRSRIAIDTAARLSSWTAEEIRKNPLIIYERKVRPPMPVILREAARSIV